eukprot:CAMPEP_0197542002 /NCGR_PEP_ID=MMETSP1318-20131121/67463_1 /TAXON_ID=552666 /ORGANISM="Partenskyella glossopodia, Strain RCC365" /LENGTH=202 /DNA_ID=CAMNT_0043101229 /DNA_START=1655 /DNA_END=2263 /DNA_ORIENTATION=-
MIRHILTLISNHPSFLILQDDYSPKTTTITRENDDDIRRINTTNNPNPLTSNLTDLRLRQSLEEEGDDDSSDWDASDDDVCQQNNNNNETKTQHNRSKQNLILYREIGVFLRKIKEKFPGKVRAGFGLSSGEHSGDLCEGSVVYYQDVRQQNETTGSDAAHCESPGTPVLLPEFVTVGSFLNQMAQLDASDAKIVAQLIEYS